MSVRIFQYGKREDAAMSVNSDSCGSAVVYVESVSSLSGPSPKFALRSHASNLYKTYYNLT